MLRCPWLRCPPPPPPPTMAYHVCFFVCDCPPPSPPNTHIMDHNVCFYNCDCSLHYWSCCVLLLSLTVFPKYESCASVSTSVPPQYGSWCVCLCVCDFPPQYGSVCDFPNSNDHYACFYFCVCSPSLWVMCVLLCLWHFHTKDHDVCAFMSVTVFTHYRSWCLLLCPSSLWLFSNTIDHDVCFCVHHAYDFFHTL